MIVSLSNITSIALYIFVFIFSAYTTKLKIKSKFLKFIIISFFPFLISGLRYNVGWDYGSYALGFDLYDPSFSILKIFSDYKFGDSIGLNIILYITKSLDSKFLYFAITSAFCFVPAFIYLFNEWNDEKNILPLTIFVTGFTLFFTGLSAIKQGIAISFCLYSLTYVYKRKLLKYLLCVFIAFLFHSSALIFFPVYLYWQKKGEMSSLKKFIIIGLSLIFVIFIESILNTFGGERFENYGTTVLITNNYLFYIMLVWLLIFIIFKRQLINIDKRNELLILLYTIAVIFMLLGYKNAFTKRIAYYFDVVQIMLIPQLIFLFTKKSRKVVIILIGIYFISTCVIANIGTAETMSPIPYSFIFGDAQ